ncbi:MAG TPA: SlyX family protein [Geobacteraceae bacterium]
MNERITDIEMHLMHQENTIQQLNDVVTRQQAMIEELQVNVKLIMQQLRTICPSTVRDAEDEELPPHY